MAKLFNRAKMDTSTTGSGTITLGSAVDGYQSFADAGVADSDVVQYVIEDGTGWEIGTGTYSASGTSLTRTPSESSNSGSALSLTGAAEVFITAVADDLNRLQNAGSTKVEATSTGATVTGNLAVTGTVDGRDVAVDGTKLDNIEANADVTDTANVTAAGALMDSEVTNLTQVKAFDSADYVGVTGDSMTGALSISQGTAGTASLSVTNSGGHTNNALIASFVGDSDAIEIRNDAAGDYKIINSQQGNGVSIYDGTGGVKLRYNGSDVAGCDSSGGFEVTSGNLSVTNNITVSGTVDGRDIAADGTKLDGIEASADVTDTANVTAAGALMDSELTSEASVKALDQGVSTTDSPTFASPSVTDLYVDDQIISTGDTDTYFQFHAANQARIVCAGGEVMEWGASYAQLGDNDQLRLGGGSDFRLYHDGSSNFIRNYNHANGNIYIQGEDTSGVNHTIAAFYSNNTAPYAGLFYDDLQVFTTTSGGVSVVGDIAVTGTVDGRDVASDGTKLDGIESSADVTDTTNVTAAGALMDSELTSEASVKAIDQGLATTDSPTFADLTLTNGVSLGGDVLPDTDNTGVVGNASFTWNNGEFTNFKVNSTLTVRSYIDLADSDGIRFGSSDDSRFWYNGTSNMFQIEMESACLGHRWTNNGTEIAFLEKSTGNLTLSGTVDGRDIASDGVKLDGIESGADVTDTASVTAAGALMDSECTSLASVKALNQGVATTDSPTFAGMTLNGTLTLGANVINDVEDIYLRDRIYHDGDTNTYMQFHAADQWRIVTAGAERLEVNSTQITSTEPIHAPSFHGDGSALTGISGSGGIQARALYNSTGTQAFRDEAGFSTLTDGGTGVSTLGFDTAQSNANYAHVASAGDATAGAARLCYINEGSSTTSSCRIRVENSSTAAADAEYVATMVLGD